MPTKLHKDLTGSDLHPNKVDATTGTELTTPSEVIYDGRWLKKTGGTITGTVTLDGTLNVGADADKFYLRDGGSYREVQSLGGAPLVLNRQGNNVGINLTDPSAPLDIGGNTLRLRNARTPASATASGNTGDICWDSNYLYLCISPNVWRRIAHSSW
jgi:hypothetical protein